VSDTPETDRCVKECNHIKGLEEKHWVGQKMVTFQNPIVQLCCKFERELNNLKNELIKCNEYNDELYRKLSSTRIEREEKIK
jgi:hypothetical protein